MSAYSNYGAVCSTGYKCSATSSGSSASCVAYPDLDITSVTFNSSYNAGSVISVKYTIKNIGKKTANSSLTKLWLSQNTSTSSGNTLKYNSSEGSLTANGTRIVTRTITLPKTMASGTWYIGVQADGAGQVAEYSESNNWYWRALKVNKSVYIDTAVAEYKTPQVGKYVSGSTVSYKCPTGSAAIGIHAYYSSFIRRYRLYCRKLNSSGTWGSAAYTSYLGTSSTGSSYIKYGTTHTWMVRANGRFSSNYQESIQGYSRTWQDILKGASNSSAKAFTNIGDTSGNSIYYATCPNGYVITGIYGRHSFYPRKMGFYCRKLKGAW
jgi:hypothetical protein